MRVVVTGATSFLGSAMVRELAADHHEICAVIRPHSASRKRLAGLEGAVRILELDLREIGQIGEYLDGSWDLFFHFAWDGSGSAGRQNEAVQQANVFYALQALEGAAALGCRRFLFPGSQAEYGLCRERMTEDTPCRPRSAYGKAKQDFARQARQRIEEKRSRGIPFPALIHVRIFSVYGPQDRPGTLIDSCIRHFRKGEAVALGACTQLWNYLYITDLTAALKALMLVEEPGPEPRIFNIAGEETATRPLRDYVEEIRSLCGGRGEACFDRLPPNAEGPADLIPDITRITGLTGWRPRVSFAEGIRQILEQMEAEQNRGPADRT